MEVDVSNGRRGNMSCSDFGASVTVRVPHSAPSTPTGRIKYASSSAACHDFTHSSEDGWVNVRPWSSGAIGKKGPSLTPASAKSFSQLQQMTTLNGIPTWDNFQTHPGGWQHGLGVMHALQSYHSILADVRHYKKSIEEEKARQQLMQLKLESVLVETQALQESLGNANVVLENQMKITKRIMGPQDVQFDAYIGHLEEELAELQDALVSVETKRKKLKKEFEQQQAASTVTIHAQRRLLEDLQDSQQQTSGDLQTTSEQLVQQKACGLDFFVRSPTTEPGQTQDRTSQLIQQARANKQRKRVWAPTSKATSLNIEAAKLYKHRIEEEVAYMQVMTPVQQLLWLRDVSSRFTSVGQFNSRLQAVMNASHQVASLDPIEALAAIQRLGKSILQAERFVLYKVKKGIFWALGPKRYTGTAMPVGRGLAGYCALTGLPVHTNDMRHHSAYDPGIEDIKIPDTALVAALVMSARRQDSEGNMVSTVVVKAVGKLAPADATDGEPSFSKEDVFLMKIICGMVDRTIANADTFHAIIDQNARSQQILRISRSLMVHPELPQLFRGIAAGIAEMCGAQMGVLYQLDPHKNEFVGYSSRSAQRFRRPVSGLIGKAFHQGVVQNVVNVRQHNHFVDSVDLPPGCSKCSSMLLVPVLTQVGRPVGLQQAINKQAASQSILHPPAGLADEFLPEDEHYLSEFSAQVATIVENCSKLNQMSAHKKSEEYSCFNCPTLTDVSRELAYQLREKLSCGSAKLFVVDEEAQQLQVYTNTGPEFLAYPLRKGVAGHVVATGEMQSIRDIKHKAEVYDKNIDSHSTSISTMLCAPVFDYAGSRQVIGTIQAVNKRRAFFDSRDEVYIQNAAARASVLTHNAKHYTVTHRCETLQDQLAALLLSLSPANLRDLPRFALMLEDGLAELFGAQHVMLITMDDDNQPYAPNAMARDNSRERVKQKCIELMHAHDAHEIVDCEEPATAVDKYTGEIAHRVQHVYFRLVSQQDGKCLGMLYLQRISTHHLTEMEFNVARLVAMHLASLLVFTKTLGTLASFFAGHHAGL